MIITYIRSSMLNSYDLCQQRFFIEYGIGIKQPDNKSAAVGSVVHKTLELLAKRKFAEQNNQDCFDDDLLGQLKTTDCEPISLLENILNNYPMDLPHEERVKCRRLVKKALTFEDGAYDPRCLDIVAPEYPFDIVIKKPWAKYKYDTPNGPLEGYLSIKGTVDLIIKHDEDTYEIRDYKTGRPWDWAKNKEKDEAALYKDQQLRLYHYAACQVFPEIENVLLSIYYIDYDKPFLLAFDRCELAKTEEFLRKKFEKIRANNDPQLNISFRCKFCPFSKQPYGDGQTVCEFFRDKIQIEGYEKTMAAHARWDQINLYGIGGGKRERE